MLPRITVVTPSYNQARFIRATIDSVLTQGYPNLEYIILDGDSADGSKEIIEEYSSSLAHWFSEKDGGQAAAIRKGFSIATGEILCWLNSDDLYLPGALLAIGRYFAENPEVEVVNGGGFVIDEDGNPLLDGFWTYTEGVSASYGRFKWYEQDGVFQQATFWRRSAYEAVGGIDPNYFFIMDKDLFARLARRRRFAVMHQLLACFRLHNECKTRLHEARRQAEERQFAAAYRKGYAARVAYPIIYSGYRLQSLCRKAFTSGALKAGLKPFKPSK